MSEFISEHDAKAYLDQYEIFPADTQTMKNLAVKYYKPLVNLAAQLHPDFGRQQCHQWVNTHVMNIVPADDHTIEDVYTRNVGAYMEGTSRGSRLIESVTFNPEYLPLLGSLTKATERSAAAGEKISARALAEQYGIDPDYAVQQVEKALPSLRKALSKTGSFFSVDRVPNLGDELRTEVARLKADNPPLGARGHLYYNEIPERARETVHAKHIAAFVEGLFVAEDTAAQKTDYLLTPIAAGLIDFAHIAKAHKVTTWHEQGTKNNATTPDHFAEREASKPALNETVRWQEPPSAVDVVSKTRRELAQEHVARLNQR